jgi:predicted transposase YdaD
MVKEKIVRYSTQLVEEAKKQGKLEMAKNLLALNISPEKIAKAAGLPLHTVKDILETA